MFNYKKMRELMISRSIDNAEMAYHTGKSETCISYITRGLKQPSLELAKRIADRLEVTVDDLILEETMETA